MILELSIVGVIAVAYVFGVLSGALLARELRIYREATRRGGDLDLTGRRS